ncbi:SPOR domain-containing protein [Streptomyces sp. A7024]|uniref:SPOR domain-containing protein n=1 Tax=Streptomyces coryli TaxID=1128680 RepID=A0A6G4TVJ8_9ACTN|nr:SPOR domain-containing protein [Streptomyces coryli]NGN63466.1 SPOR domain-containing protein [Streptomyces coryli]
MDENGVVLPWVVIRQDDNGNRYRVGRYATRAEAEKVASRFDDKGHQQLYLVERVNRSDSDGQG